MKFRKKPVEIEAIQWTGDNMEAISQFVGEDLVPMEDEHEAQTKIGIVTLEGVMTASIGDWIIKGVNGEFYPCKPDIFQKTYEEVHE